MGRFNGNVIESLFDIESELCRVDVMWGQNGITGDNVGGGRRRRENEKKPLPHNARFSGIFRVSRVWTIWPKMLIADFNDLMS